MENNEKAVDLGLAKQLQGLHAYLVSLVMANQGMGASRFAVYEANKALCDASSAIVAASAKINEHHMDLAFIANTIRDGLGLSQEDLDHARCDGDRELADLELIEADIRLGRDLSDEDPYPTWGKP